MNMRSVLVLAMTCLASIASTARSGAVFISGDDSDDGTAGASGGGHCTESRCGSLIGHLLSQLYSGCQSTHSGNCILSVGTNSSRAQWALQGDGASLLGWNAPANGGPGACVQECNDLECILTVDFAAYRVLYVASSGDHTDGGLTQEQLDALNSRADDIKTWVNDHDGRVIAFTEADMTESFGWLPNPLQSEDFEDAGLSCPSDVELAHSAFAPNRLVLDLEFPGHGATGVNLDHECYHNYFSGPLGWSGLQVLVESAELGIPDPDTRRSARIPAPVILGCCQCRLTAEHCSNGVDDDGDTLVDEADEDCHSCGDGTLDPGEQCDDGNNLDGDGCAADCTLARANAPPACGSGGPYAEECAGASGTRFVVDASSSSDPDGDSLAFAWITDCPGSFTDASAMTTGLVVRGSGCPLTCTVTVTVSDDSGASATCTSSVVVEDTLPPQLVVPAPLLLECRGSEGVAASDPELMSWLALASAADDCVLASLVNDAPAVFPGGCEPGITTIVTFQAQDACGNTTRAQSSVTVVDRTPPVILRQPVLGGGRLMLWPPQHGYATITVAMTGIEAQDLCGAVRFEFSSCTSSQPEDANGVGDGHSVRDCLVDGDRAYVRAERDGICPEGRSYGLTIDVIDECGHRTPSEPSWLGVAHDRRNPPAGPHVAADEGSNQPEQREGENGVYGAGCR